MGTGHWLCPHFLFGRIGAATTGLGFRLPKKFANFAATMSRLLAIDYGRKRTGIAVSDPLQLIAGGLTTVPTHGLLDYLANYLSREAVERIVVGLPRQTTGEASENQARVQQFVNTLKKRWPQLPVEYVDERFTSVLAHRAMLDGGLRKSARQDKALVDEVSATIILQTYMETRRIEAGRT